KGQRSNQDWRRRHLNVIPACAGRRGKKTYEDNKMNNLRINGQRLWTSLMDLAKIGATDKGGVKRLALTDLDRQGRDLVLEWAKAEGLAITIDQIGNVFMRREGTNPALPPVVTGSHI